MTIVDELRKDRENGAKRLESEYRAGLMTLARRFCSDEGDAEELVNRTFAAVVNGIDDYLEQSAFFGWMCQIMSNLHGMEQRRKSRQMECSDPAAVDGAADVEGADRIVRGVDASILRDAIEELPREDKEVLLMHYFMDLPVARIARILSAPEGTVKWRLHGARLALGAKLGAVAKKPGGKALLIALALAALTAAGAATSLAVVRLLSPHRAAQEQQADNSKDAAAPEQQAYNSKAAALEQQADDSDPDVSLVTRLPSLVTQETAQSASSPSFTTQPSQQETTMNATTRVFLAASAAFAAATGTPLAALADDYVVNVPLDETQTIDATLVADIGTKNLVKTGRGTLVSSADMASYTGTITIREGAFEIKTTSDLGTADGGTVVEDGGTLLVDMASGQERFPNEPFTIAGTGDAAYGAAVYQSVPGNDRFKLFKYLTLSGDATIRSSSRLGVDGGTLTMNGHTLTLKGVNYQFRDVTYASPLGNIVLEANLTFVRNQTATADATKTLTIGNGGTVGFSEAYTTPSFWALVVAHGGKIVSSTASTSTWGSDVVWNAATEDGITGLLTFTGDVTGTGSIKASSATLTFAKPLGANVSLGLSGTATAILKGCSYSHKGMMTGMRTDGWTTGFNTDRSDTRWSYCDYGPGPQLSRDVAYWDANDPHSSGKARMWCSRGYLWNREATNVTYTVFVGSVYENWIYLDGNYATAVYDNKRDSWGSCSIEVPAKSCRQIDIRTSDGKSYGGPRSDSDKAKINGVIANDPTGYYFTTNAVSVLENTPALTTLSLADDGVLDANKMPVSVGTLAGYGLVTNVTTLTVSDSWSLAAADVIDGATLEVYGDVVFGNGATISVSNLRSLPVAQTYTICKADSIAGIANGTLITEQARTWKVVLSGDGTTLSIENVPQATVVYVR